MGQGQLRRQLLAERAVRVVMSTPIHLERLAVLLVAVLVVREQQRAVAVLVVAAELADWRRARVVQAHRVQKFRLLLEVRQVQVVAVVVVVEPQGKAVLAALVASTGVAVVQVALEQTTATAATAHKVRFGSPTQLHLHLLTLSQCLCF